MTGVVNVEYSEILSINIPNFHAPVQLCHLPDLKVCRCCLATDTEMAYSSEYFDILLDLLTASKLSNGPDMSWLCYRCAHTMKKLSSFRDLCTRADTVLREYNMKYMDVDKGDLHFIKEEHRKIIVDFSPTYSNILCLDVLTQSVNSLCNESRVNVLSFNNRSNTKGRNFSEGMKAMDRSNVAALELLDKDIGPNYNINLELNPASFGLSDAVFQIVTLEESGKTETLVQPKKKDSEIMSPELASVMCDFICTFSCKACKQTFGNPRCIPNHYKFCKGKRIERVEIIAGVVRNKPSKDHSVPTKNNQIEMTTPTVISVDNNKNELANNDTNIIGKVKDISYDCSKCGKSFSQPSFLKRHSLSHTNEKPFRCERCNKCFRTLYHLKSHAWTHLERKSHACTVCGRSFPHISYLRSHMKSHISNEPFNCDNCGKSYETSNELKLHKLTHDASEQICSICSAIFPCSSSLSEHRNFSSCGSKLINPDGEVHACHVCQRVFHRASALQRHILSHTQDRPFICKRCGKSFKLSSQLKAHNWIHEEQKPFVCEVCGATFHCPSYLKVHMLKHSGQRPHVCSQCGKAFKTLGNLNVHATIHTGLRPYTCPCCGLTARSVSMLREHVRSHTNHKPFVCGVCGKAFHRSTTLKVHTRIHTGEKPFPCKMCDKRFMRVGDLIVHTRTHTGERPYSCETCGKAFASRGTLVTHWKVHTSIKQYVCDQCGKSFTGLSYLKVHKRIHSGERFSCELCPYKTICRSRLRIHRMVHTGERPHVCDECGYKTTTLKNLKRHKQTHKMDNDCKEFVS